MQANRRDFLKTSAVAGAGFLVGAGNFRKQARASALQSVAVAGIGVGGKGGGDITHAGYYGKVVAICDVDKRTLEGKGNEFISVRYLDAYEGDYLIKTFYAGPQSANCGHRSRWLGITANLIEK